MEFVIKVDDDFTFDVYEEEEEEAQKSSDQHCSLDFRIKEESDDFDFEHHYYFDQKFTKSIDVKTESEPNEEREDEDEEDREIEILRFDNETSLDSLPNLNEENEEMMNIVNSLMNEDTSSLLSQNNGLITNGDEVFQTIDSPFSNLNIADFDTPLFEELDLTTDVLTETSERNDSFTDNLELSENSIANLFKIVDVRSCAIEETHRNNSSTDEIEENVTVDNQVSDFDISSSQESTSAKKRRIDKESENNEDISLPLFEEITKISNRVGNENVDSSTSCGVKKRKIEDTVENQSGVSSLVVEENVFDNNVKSLEVSIVDSAASIEEIMCQDDKIKMPENLIVNVSTCQGQVGCLKSSILDSEKRKIEDGNENQGEISSSVVEENVFDTSVKSLEALNEVDNTEETRLDDGFTDKVVESNEDISNISVEDCQMLNNLIVDVNDSQNQEDNLKSSVLHSESLKSSCCEVKKGKIEDENENQSDISSSVNEENAIDNTVKSLESVIVVNNTEETCPNNNSSDKIEEIIADISSLLEKAAPNIPLAGQISKNSIDNIECQSQENNVKSLCSSMKKRKIEDENKSVEENVFDNNVKSLETVSDVDNTKQTCLNNSVSDKIEESTEDIVSVLEKNYNTCTEGMSEDVIVNVNKGQGDEDNLKSLLFDKEKVEFSCSEMKKRKIESRNENQSEISSSITEEDVFDNIVKSFEAVNCTEGICTDKSLSDKIDENKNNEDISSPLEKAFSTYDESGQTSEDLIDNVNDCQICENDPKSSLLDNENVESLCFEEIEDVNENQSGVSSSEIEENSFDKNVKSLEDSNINNESNAEEVRQDNDEENKNNKYISSQLKEENIIDTCVESVELSENLIVDCQNQFSDETVEMSSFKVVENGNANQNEISSIVSEENTIFDNSVKSSEISFANTEEWSNCHDSGLTNEYKMEEANVRSSIENLTDDVSNIVFDNEAETLSTEEKFEVSSLTVSITDDGAIVESIVKEETAAVDDSCQTNDKSFVFENKENVPDSPINNKIEIKADDKNDLDTTVKQDVHNKSSVRVTESSKKVPPNVVKSVISDRPNEVSNLEKPQTSKTCHNNVKPKPTPNSSSPNRFNNGSKKFDFKPSRNSFKSRNNNNNTATRQGHRYVGNTDRSRFRQFPRPNFNRNPNVNNYQNNNVFSGNNSFNNCQNLQNWQCYNIILDALKTLIYQRNYQNIVNCAQNVSTQLNNQYCQQQQQNLLDFQRQQSRVQNGNQRLVFDSVSFNFRRQNVRENNFRINPTISKTYSFHKKNL